MAIKEGILSMFAYRISVDIIQELMYRFGIESTSDIGLARTFALSYASNVLISHRVHSMQIIVHAPYTDAKCEDEELAVR